MKILVPVDKSRRDGIVLPYAVRFAQAFEATIVLVHSIPLTRSLIPSATREAEAYITATAAGLEEKGLKAEAVVHRGDPASAIVAVAEEFAVDLIVMATRGRNGLGKLLLGSVASAVLSNCHKPVLLLSEGLSYAPEYDEGRLQAAYLGTVVWHREAKGLYSKEEAETELNRLTALGLDEAVLFAAYKDGGRQSALFGLLDYDFQISTLRQFFPEEAHTWIQEEPLQFQEKPAA